MARELYRSLREKILPLPDAVRIYPGHGAGSACGKALSSEGSSATVSTLGEQRTENYVLAPITEEAFVTAVTEGLAEPPEYFAQEVVVNRAGHASFDAGVPVVPYPAPSTCRCPGCAHTCPNSTRAGRCWSTAPAATVPVWRPACCAPRGFTDVSDLLGGWNAWQAERDGAVLS
ncbi:MAG: hypothetical protein ACR2G2_00450 [Pseudonocardia sp.]